MEKKPAGQRALAACKEAVKPSLSTIWFLLRVMLPVSLGVLLLEASGVLFRISALMDPLMGYLGLPGRASLVFLSSVLVNIYSAIAVLETLDLSAREIIILATVCTIAHNFFVELAVLKKTGSPIIRMAFLRIACALLAAWVLHYILPGKAEARPDAPFQEGVPAPIGIDPGILPALLVRWLKEGLFLILRVVPIILGLMILQKLLAEFGLITFLGRLTAPLMRVFGLSANAGYLWIVANLVGLVYGSAILIEELRSERLSLSEAKLFNHHVAISHSQFEDTLLFTALGAPFLWAALPRLIMAIAVVWLELLRRFLFRRSFRVKIM
jgi:spore maturation protein SpmB